ncbi:hypothetical protein [Kitasatospora sp. NPDC087314]|uniref:hypothetical protein n=1 Tax=Kitasatospora sp. NPDC087314 TaxID=3364068 RepID=UPI00381615AD
MTQPQPDAPLDLDAIQARAEAATPGPWHVEEDRRDYTRWVATLDGTLGINFGYLGNRTEGDAAFVAAARTDVEALLARVRELEAELARANRSSYSGRHVWEAWAEEGDHTLCTTEADAKAAAIQIWSESEYDGSDRPKGFIPGWHETAWGLELLDDGEHTGVFVARHDVFGRDATDPEPAPSGPQTAA